MPNIQRSIQTCGTWSMLVGLRLYGKTKECEDVMEYQEILRNAKENMGGFCLACPICNGLACKTKIPGPGRKGTGDAYTRNFAAFGKVKINIDTLFEQKEISTELEMFGEKFRIPVFAAPIGAPADRDNRPDTHIRSRIRSAKTVLRG